MDSNLKFRRQAASAVCKATQILAVILHDHCQDPHLNEQTLTLLYKALVRPHLEYGNMLRGPFNHED